MAEQEIEFEGDALLAAPAPSGPPLALYRRYRPDTFADVIGQEHVTGPLQRALLNDRVNHAYLFSGPRGCGKTTSARILARSLNCEQGPTPEPCGQCQSCQDLARGGPGSIDVIEIDAASHGGVDDARDLRERAFFSPVSSRYKVYIIDEAHMVTTQGFNALLKLVEEPPPHVKFIFATTEPEKVIGTIRSRTHHYPFRLVPPKVLGGYLADLCAREGVHVEPAVLPLVVRAGAGSVRDSLSVLDQLLGGAGEQGVDHAQAAALLGYTPDSLLDEMVDAFAAGDGAGVFAAVDKVVEVGQDPRRFAEDLLRRLRDLVVVAAVPDAVSKGLVAAADDQVERLASQAAVLGSGELTRAAEVIADGLTAMRGTTAPRLHLELMCSRVLLPGADVDERGVHARLDRLERRLAMGGAAAESEPGDARSQPVPTAEASPVATQAPTMPAAQTDAEPTPAPSRPAASQSGANQSGASQSGANQSSIDRAGADASRGTTAESSREQSSATPEPAVQPVDRPAPSSAPAAGFGTADLRRLWPEVLEEVKRQRRFTWILLSQNATVVDVVDGVLTLGLSNAGARESFAKGGSEEVLKEAIVAVAGVDLRLQTMVGDGGVPHSNAATQVSVRRPESPSSAAAPPATPRESRSGAGAASNGPSEGDTDQEPAPAPTSGTDSGDPAAVRPAPAVQSPAGGRLSPPPASVREAIRPTRAATVAEKTEDPDLDRSDTSVDESAVDHDELLSMHLGAELIAEEHHQSS